MKKPLLYCLFFLISLKGFTGEVILLSHSEGTAEVYIQKKQEGAPVLLFLHGASSDNGWRGISDSWFNYWVQKGYSVCAISMPGYGKTTGRKDFCGPLTMKALHFAVDAIKEDLGVTTLGVVGFGQGSTAALLLASQREDLSCVVSANGAYDLRRHLHKKDLFIEALTTKNYAISLNEEEFRIRSPIAYADCIKIPVFVLHREKNPVIHEDEVYEFAEALLQQGTKCEVSILPKTLEADEQKLSYEEILQETEIWVEAYMNLSK